MKHLKLSALALTICILLIAGCSDDPTTSNCLSCPEENPAATAALAYIDAHQADFDLREEVDEMMIRTIEEDDLGMTHVRLDQHYRGVRVVQGELIVHLDKELIVKSVSGMTVPGINVDIAFQVSSDTALNTALTDFSNSATDGGNIGNGELVVFPWLGTNHLCWDFEILSATLLTAFEYFVSAHSGDIIHKQSLIIQ